MARKPTELRPLMTRLPERLRARLAKAAKVADQSMNAEIVERLERSFEIADLAEQVRKRYAEAEAQKDAARIAAIRQAGFVIVREHGGKIAVQVSPELLLAEADGIFRSGFVAAENVNKPPMEIAIENAVERGIKKALSGDKQ